MNRIKNHNKQIIFTPSVLVVLALCCLVAIVGGVNYAILKNSQDKISAEIEKTQNRVGNLEIDIDSETMKIAQRLDRYTLQESLRKYGSDLAPRPPGQIATIYIGRDDQPIAFVPSQSSP